MLIMYIILSTMLLLIAGMDIEEGMRGRAIRGSFSKTKIAIIIFNISFAIFFMLAMIGYAENSVC
jgi:hypothetical protein